MPDVITTVELERLYKKEPIQIIDVREESEFAIEHIPNAINLPLSAFPEIVSGLNKKREYYVVCAGSNRSEKASKELRALGFNVTYVEGGMNAWSGEIETN